MLLVKSVHCFRDWTVKLTIYLVNQQKAASVVVSDIKHTDFSNTVSLFIS